MSKPEIFIGSSTEYGDLATKVAACIDKNGGEPKRWTDDGLFPAGEYTWDRLKRLSAQFDGAIFIFGCDDKVEFRNKKGYQPRDNVLMEFGLFSGVLPRQAVVFFRVGESRTPVDLDGLTYIDDKEGNFGPSAELGVKDWLANLKTIGPDPCLTSIFPIMEFKADGDNILRALRYSDSCREFYGYADYAVLSKKPVTELIEHIRQFILPPAPHWDDFQEDQASVIKKHEQGELPLAQVPIIFNGDHPRFPGKSFVPLIVEKIGEGKGSITRVLYLDVAQLPKAVFGEPIWSNLSKNIDLTKLSSELKQIADDWKRAVPEVAPERVEALRAAADEAANSGSLKVVTNCGEAGFFAVRSYAQKGDYPNAKQLLRRILALTHD